MPDLYTQSIRMAKAMGELDLYRESKRANIICKNGIERMISDRFDGQSLHGDCIRELCDEYGVDRVGWVLANTVQNHPWDGRFRHYNKTWAQEYPIPNEPEDCTYEYSINSHPEIVNGLIDQFRAFTQEQNESSGFGMQL